MDDIKAVCVVAWGTERTITVFVPDAARIILWVAQHQAELREKGAWTFDHAPGSIAVTKVSKETIT